MTNAQMILNMKELQDSFNEKTVKGWRYEISSEQWKTAIVTEASEAIESLDFKFWKKGKNDWDNYLVEQIDLWHFLMSLHISVNNHYDLEYLWDITNEIDINETKDADIHIEKCKELIANTLSYEVHDAITTFFVIWRMIGLDIIDLYRGYLVKNTLNEFRRKNGYKDGTYIKMWNYQDSAEVEDNKIVFEIACDIKVEDLQNNLYKEIETFYKEM